MTLTAELARELSDVCLMLAVVTVIATVAVLVGGKW
jgi:hypothetical protein